MTGKFTLFRKSGGAFCLTLMACLVVFFSIKKRTETKPNDSFHTSEILVSNELIISRNTSTSVVDKPQFSSHTAIHALNVEAGIRERYGVLFNEIPEANLYFEFLAKSGIPEQFHWRAFRVLHDFALRLGEHDRDVEVLKSRLTEMESVSGGKTDPGTVSEIESAKLEIKSAIERRSWFQERGYEALRKYHPQLSNETLETLFRFRPKEIPFALPHVERDDVFLGTEP